MQTSSILYKIMGEAEEMKYLKAFTEYANRYGLNTVHLVMMATVWTEMCGKNRFKMDNNIWTSFGKKYMEYSIVGDKKKRIRYAEELEQKGVLNIRGSREHNYYISFHRKFLEEISNMETNMEKLPVKDGILIPRPQQGFEYVVPEGDVDKLREELLPLLEEWDELKEYGSDDLRWMLWYRLREVNYNILSGYSFASYYSDDPELLYRKVFKDLEMDYNVDNRSERYKAPVFDMEFFRFLKAFRQPYHFRREYGMGNDNYRRDLYNAVTEASNFLKWFGDTDYTRFAGWYYKEKEGLVHDPLMFLQYYTEFKHVCLHGE